MTAHILKWQAEHETYRRLLGLLAAESRALVRGEEADYELMSDIVYYMTQYPDHLHHPREDVAFAALLSYAPAVRPIVDALSVRHERVRRAGLALASELAAAAADVTLARRTIQTDVRDYAEHFRAHVEAEEREIFPRLAVSLTPKDWFLIDSRIYFNDDPLFGDGLQARFRSLQRKIAARAGCGCGSH